MNREKYRLGHSLINFSKIILLSVMQFFAFGLIKSLGFDPPHYSNPPPPPHPTPLIPPLPLTSAYPPCLFDRVEY